MKRAGRGRGRVGGGDGEAPSGPPGDSRSGLRRQLIKGSCVERAAAQLIPFSPPKGKLQRGAPLLKLLQLAALPASSSTRFFFFANSVSLLLLCLAIMKGGGAEGGHCSCVVAEIA